MPQAKKTPTKRCEWCENMYVRSRVGRTQQLECVSNFMRRKFCSRSCSVSAQHANQSTTQAASRKRAASFMRSFCEACGFGGELNVHHVNGDPLDNRPSNCQTLCAYCHGFWHATLKRTGKPLKKPMPRLIAWDDCAATETP